MKEFINYDLFKYNTMRLHCVASHLYEPENENELRQLIKQLMDSENDFRVLGGGSNILMPDNVDNVVSLRSLKAEVVIEEGSRIVKADASVPIQKLIKTCQEHGLGGIEFLFSLPCQLGGAIYMNAGRGGRNTLNISKFVKSVTYVDSNTGDVHTITKDNCQFSHRKSIFQEKKWLILCADLELEQKTSDSIQEEIDNRLERSRKYLDAGKPSCGSVFCRYNTHILSLLKGVKIGGAQYSKKTKNWISNNGNATYRDVLKLIRLAIFLHRITFQKYKVEIIIWK